MAGKQPVQVMESGGTYAAGWEQMSRQTSEPRHAAGWNPEGGSADFTRQRPADYQRLAGPWTDDRSDPAA